MFHLRAGLFRIPMVVDPISGTSNGSNSDRWLLLEWAANAAVLLIFSA